MPELLGGCSMQQASEVASAMSSVGGRLSKEIAGLGLQAVLLECLNAGSGVGISAAWRVPYLISSHTINAFTYACLLSLTTGSLPELPHQSRAVPYDCGRAGPVHTNAGPLAVLLTMLHMLRV
jgi:hypothetical protein